MQVGDLNKSVRHLTPQAFAEWLVSEVRRRLRVWRIAVLFCDLHGPYPGMSGVECWPVLAQYYTGPYPIIAHPPCESWGRFRWKARQDNHYCGNVAIDAVHQFRGVIEHPWRSRLFIEYGRPGHTIETIDQSRWGHRARKRTDLYWVV